MTSKPAWLTKKTIVLHNSGVCFLPVQLKSNGNQQFAIDALSTLYPIDECKPATPESFLEPREFINADGSVVWVERTPRGLSINSRERVRLKDDVDIACDRLAECFNGAIVSDAPEKFAIQEDIGDEDW